MRMTPPASDPATLFTISRSTRSRSHRGRCSPAHNSPSQCPTAALHDPSTAWASPRGAWRDPSTILVDPTSTACRDLSATVSLQLRINLIDLTADFSRQATPRTVYHLRRTGKDLFPPQERFSPPQQELEAIARRNWQPLLLKLNKFPTSNLAKERPGPATFAISCSLVQAATILPLQGWSPHQAL